ncbi:MAG: hypothetical protein ACFFDI_26945 [Promethearchaeota archaeon]
MEDCIMDLSGERVFYIEGSEVMIPRELQADTTEAEAAINALLKSFEEFEKKGKGKV